MAKKNLKDIHPLVPVLCDAIMNNNYCITKHLSRITKQEHMHIKEFQENICDHLKINSDYKWETEKKAGGRTERDSIDIYGESNDELCIIEIDATRIDQIAQKFVSRLCLWGLEEGTKKPLLYIALLYKGSNSHSRIEDCEKYIRYCNKIYCCPIKIGID